MRVCNREVAVDFSMGRSVYQRVQDEKEAKGEEENIGVANSEIDLMAPDKSGNENEDEGEDEDGEEEEKEEEGGNEEGNMDMEGEEGEEEEEEEEEEEVEDENDMDDVVKGCTVFVRYVRYILKR